MTPRLSVPIRSGSLDGLLFWDVENASFGVRFGAALDVGTTAFEPPRPRSISNRDLGGRPSRRSDSPIPAHSAGAAGGSTSPIAKPVENRPIGGRLGEFPTIDRLLNHLALVGLTLDAESVETATTFRDRVTAVFGDVELVGIDGGGGGRLVMVLPNLATVSLNERIAAPEFRFGWGQVGGAAIETARAMLGAAWSSRWGSDEEMCAEALVYHLLADCGPTFSVNANSLCDWCLLDEELTTALTADQLLRIERYQPATPC